MKLFIIAVGHKMPNWINQGFHEYAKRMPTDCKIELREIKPEPRTSHKNTAQILALEHQKILATLPKQTIVVVLDERGENWTSPQLANALKNWQQQGQHIAFIIGSADGLADDLKQQAQHQLRLSNFTLPHSIVRIMLAEQLYRAWTILQQHPYHRA